VNAWHPSQRWLTLLIAAGMIGLLTDLLLIGHDEDVLQFIPLIALALASTALIARLFSQARWFINVATVILILMAASGALGLWLHYRANAAFQQEMDPTLAGLELLWKTLRTKSPPAMAPGQMVLLSLLALIIIRQPTPSHQGHQP
jgi:hypothetical protein